MASMLLVGLLGCAGGTAVAAVRVEGQVQAGRGPLANSTVTKASWCFTALPSGAYTLDRAGQTAVAGRNL